MEDEEKEGELHLFVDYMGGYDFNKKERKTVKKLNLEFSIFLEEISLDDIERLRKLEELVLYTKMFDEDSRVLEDDSWTESYYLELMEKMVNTKIPIIDFSPLVKCRKLKRLAIIDFVPTIKTFKPLINCPKLERLRLSEIHLEGETKDEQLEKFSVFKDCKPLKSIEVSGHILTNYLNPSLIQKLSHKEVKIVKDELWLFDDFFVPLDADGLFSHLFDLEF
ncbi:MAG: hypothetical protein ACTSUR_05145 [Candidatus Heimdallarchaeaceae archaeon]